MAKFKVGDRVRMVAYTKPEDATRAIAAGVAVNDRVRVGCEATIVRRAPQHWLADWEIAVDGHGLFSCYSYSLAPLTDPKADAFLESIRKLKPLDEPLVREYLIDGVKWTVTEPADAGLR